MEDADGPEGDLVGRLAGFVSEALLSKESSGPSSDEFEQVERVLGDAPTVGLGAHFVRGVEKPSDYPDQYQTAC